MAKVGDNQRRSILLAEFVLEAPKVGDNQRRSILLAEFVLEAPKISAGDDCDPARYEKV